jgi:ATP-dependent Lon protease
VAVGLAWTYVGGDILFVETSLSDGKGDLKLTGNLGNVMKESALPPLPICSPMPGNTISIRRSSIRRRSMFMFPEGAVPKDGPSAGVTMMSSMASAFTASGSSLIWR